MTKIRGSYSGVSGKSRDRSLNGLGLHGIMVVIASHEGVTEVGFLVEEGKSSTSKEEGRVAMCHK